MAERKEFCWRCEEMVNPSKHGCFDNTFKKGGLSAGDVILAVVFIGFLVLFFYLAMPSYMGDKDYELCGDNARYYGLQGGCIPTSPCGCDMIGNWQEYCEKPRLDANTCEKYGRGYD